MRLVFFIHGYGFPNKFLGIKYWGNIPKLLNKNNCEKQIYLELECNSFGSIKQNSIFLASQFNCIYNRYSNINEILFITHSKGGLDILDVIDLLDENIKNKINKIIALNTPLFGVKKTNRIGLSNSFQSKTLVFFAKLLSFILGDKKAEVRNSMIDLGSNYVDKLEQFLKNNEIEYHLYYIQLKYNELNLFWKLMSKSYYDKNNLGDGVVDFTGIDSLYRIKNDKLKIFNYKDYGLSDMTHWSITGMFCFNRQIKNKLLNFYKDIGASMK